MGEMTLEEALAVVGEMDLGGFGGKTRQALGMLCAAAIASDKRRAALEHIVHPVDYLRSLCPDGYEFDTQAALRMAGSAGFLSGIARDALRGEDAKTWPV